MKFSELLGMTLREIKGTYGDGEMILEEVTGKRFRLYHEQDCCESVWLEDICGELSDLLDSPLLEAD